MRASVLTRRSRNVLQSMVLIILISTFPVWFLFLQNIDEVTFSEIIVPLLVYMAVGFAALLFSMLELRGRTQGGIIAALWTVALLNFSYIDSLIRTILPEARYWHSFLTLVVVLVYLSLLLKKPNEEISKTIVLVLSFVLTGLLAINGVTAVTTLVSGQTAGNGAIQQTEIKVAVNEGDKPNVYFLLYDEYSSNKVLSEHYDYDNSSFTDMLESLGFYVSNSSHNDSCDTKTVMTNLMNLDYIVSNKTPLNIKKQYWNDNSVMKRLFVENGYKFFGAGNSATFDIAPVYKSSGAVTNGATTIDGNTPSAILINRTFLNILPKIFQVSVGINDATVIKNLLHSDFFNFWQADSTYDNDGGIFWLGYLILPHQPFIYTAKGLPVDPLNYNNWTDEQYYLGQLIYTTKLITQQIQTILQHDPDSIIVLQSDHSARRLDGNTLNFSEVSTSCFNAVYFRGKDMKDIEGLSNVNTWRLVVNRLFGTTYEFVEVPAYDQAADGSDAK